MTLRSSVMGFPLRAVRGFNVAFSLLTVGIGLLKRNVFKRILKAAVRSGSSERGAAGAEKEMP